MYVVKNGQFEILKWMINNGCELNTPVSIIAALNGNLEILKWMDEITRDEKVNRCLWNEVTCECAAEGGHLEVLKWLRKNGCPWDEMT